MSLLQVQNISKRFDNCTDALTEVSFSVEKEEFVSVIGPSGSGKTTLFRILNGMIGSDNGTITLQDQLFTGLSGKAKRTIQKKIGTIYQDFCLIESVSCLQNVLNACLPDMSVFPAALGLFSRAQKEEAAKLLARVGLVNKLEESVSNLSGGQKQRVAIARALMRHPVLLLADEPTAALDPVTGRQILELLSDIQKNDHLTILMNSHNLELAKEYSTRLIGLSDGRIVYDNDPKSLDAQSLTRIYGKESEGIYE